MLDLHCFTWHFGVLECSGWCVMDHIVCIGECCWSSRCSTVVEQIFILISSSLSLPQLSIITSLVNLRMHIYS